MHGPGQASEALLWSQSQLWPPCVLQVTTIDRESLSIIVVDGRGGGVVDEREWIYTRLYTDSSAFGGNSKFGNNTSAGVAFSCLCSSGDILCSIQLGM